MAFNPEHQTRIVDGLVIPTRHPFYRRAGHRVRDLIDDFNLIQFCYKLVAATYVFFILWLTYLLLPLPGNWSPNAQADDASVPVLSRNLSNQSFPEEASHSRHRSHMSSSQIVANADGEARAISRQDEAIIFGSADQKNDSLDSMR